MAGGQVSDQTRIEWMQEKLTATAVSEMGQHKALLRTLGKPLDMLQTNWLAYSDALISVCSEVQDEEQQLPGVRRDQNRVDAAVVPAGQKKKTAGRQLENQQVTAIHRYAVSMGLEFKEVSLEEVVAAPGGVEKFSKMTATEAMKEYKDSQEKAEKTRLPICFPVLMPRKASNEAKRSYKQAVLSCLTQTRGV
jgi:hypothetical protein